MHEMSLAQEVCNIAESQVPPDQVSRIVAVGLEVGLDAGIEPNSLTFWLEFLLTSPPFKAARPVVEQVEGSVFRVTYLEVDDGGPED